MRNVEPERHAQQEVLAMAEGMQQGIQSLETGIRLFQELQRLNRPATLSELAKLTRMAPAKVHRYCVSLIRTGLLQQDGRGLYAVGPYGLQVGPKQADFETARKLAVTALPRLVREMGETAFVSGWGQTGPVILTIEEPSKPVSVRPNWRGDLPLWNSATGRAFAAYLPPDRLNRFIDAELKRQRFAEKISETEIGRRKRNFFRHISDVQKYGVARTTGERYPGVVSFAAPIFDADGKVILALTSFGLAASYSSAWDSAAPRYLRAYAHEITNRIGGKKPS